MAAKRQRDEEDEAEAAFDAIDRLLADSFPASDPPSWTLGRERRASTGGEAPTQAPGARAR